MTDIQARLEITLGQHGAEKFNGGNGGYCRCGQYLYGGTLAAHQAEMVKPLMAEVWEQGKAGGIKQADWEYGARLNQFIATNPYIEERT